MRISRTVPPKRETPAARALACLGCPDQGPSASGRDLPHFGPPPLPAPPSALRSARAIVRTLRAARRAGRVPEALVLGPELHEQLQDPNLTYLWSSATRDALLGLPVEVDPGAEGWAVRVR